MNMDDLIEQFVSDLKFDVLVGWAEMLGVEVNYPPTGDMWADWDCELRQEVGDAMARVGQKEKI